MTSSEQRNFKTVSSQAHSHAHSDSLLENALLERCESGDDVAWDILVHRYGKLIYSYAYSFCHNYEDANDIVGLVFLHLCQHLSSYRRESSFRTWLYVIVRNIFLDEYVRTPYRKRVSLFTSLSGNNMPSSVEDFEDPAPSPEAICMDHESARILARAIQHLPANHRQPVRMYYLEGKSYEEIAESTGITLGTIKSRLSRARTMLFERITFDPDALIAG